jgi:hypothetical protein
VNRIEVKKKFRKDRIEFDDAGREIIFARKIIANLSGGFLRRLRLAGDLGFVGGKKIAGATKEQLYGMAFR